MDALELVTFNFTNALRKSMLKYQEFIQQFRYFYNNDYEMIVDTLVRWFRNKPYDIETLNKMVFIHRDEIQNILRRKCAGIYDVRPLRELWIGETQDENLTNVLEECDIDRKMYEALHQSKFFNTVILHPVFRNGKIDIDLLTAEMCAVSNKEDYLEIKAIKIQRADEAGELVYDYWSETEHYRVDGLGNKIPIPGNEQMVNPYVQAGAKLGTSPLPFVVLRDRAQYDFWGEPNWGLFLYQLQNDMDLTDLKFSEKFVKFPILTTNAKLPADLVISPNRVIDLGSSGDGTQTFLNYQNANTDWANIRENDAYLRGAMYSSEGLPESSASVSGDAPKQVGAKTIDELALVEQRENDKMKLLAVERELLRKIQMINNTYETRSEYKLTDSADSYFYVEFTDQKIQESVQDQIARREFEMRSGMKTPVDFIMEDTGLTREEALEEYNRVKEESASIGMVNQNRVQQAMQRIQGVTQ